MPRETSEKSGVDGRSIPFAMLAPQGTLPLKATNRQ
jgi:hypothetical protein